jgi:hypothetical protein
MALIVTCPWCATSIEITVQPEETFQFCPKCGKKLIVAGSEPQVRDCQPQATKVNPTTPAVKRNWRISRHLLVNCVIGIVVLTCIGLALIVVPRARERAALTATLDSMGEVVRSAHIAHDCFKKFPPYFGVYGGSRVPVTFHASLLDHTTNRMLAMTNTPGYPHVPPNQEALGYYVSAMDSTLHSGGVGACNFPVNLRLFYTDGGLGTLSPASNPIYPRMPNSFPDGTSNTLLLATKYMVCGNGGSLWNDPGHNAIDSPTAATFGASMALWQAAPPKEKCDPLQGAAVSFTPYSIQVAMCDASVRNVSINISPATWQAVHTPGANDPIGADWDN